MLSPIVVEPREGYRIWIRYEDGSEGEIDLSDMVGVGVFKAWEDRAFFDTVKIAPYRSITWGDGLDLCADALYMEITGKTIEEYMSGFNAANVNV